MARIIGCYGVLFCLTLGAQTPANTVTLTTFAHPVSSMIVGSDGDFYGVSQELDAILKITPQGAESILYTFRTSPPYPNQIIQGTDGNFYGTTFGSSCSTGCATVFKVTPSGSFTTIYTLQSSGSINGLTQGNDGNFYGTTSGDGAICQPALTAGCGTVFMLTPQGSFTVLYTFDSKHGASPSNLIKGADGNFYGTTYFGGIASACPSTDVGQTPNGCGTIFEITPAGSLTTLYTFQGTTDGSAPGNLVRAADGNFYGVVGQLMFESNGGITNQGSVFQLTPDGTLTTLASFDSANGGPPDSLIQGSDGNLYGASNGYPGVLQNGAVLAPAIQGVLIKISLPAGTLTTLYDFCQPGCTTLNPAGGDNLLQGSDGNLYGILNDNLVFGAQMFEYALVSPNAPAIMASGGLLNGASLQAGIPSGSWMTIKGTNLSTITDTWNNSIVNGALPEQLDGVKVSVGGQPAHVEYVSSGQINAIAPSLPSGTVQVTVTNSNGTSQAVNAQVAAQQPAFFLWGNYAVATRQDYSLAVKNGTFPGTTTIPAKPGDVIILWGTGFGSTNPAAPAGMETPSIATYNTANPVSVTVGTTSATVYGAALASGYAGLYQVAIQIPTSLADGDYPIVATVNGVPSPSSTLITVSTSP